MLSLQLLPQAFFPVASPADPSPVVHSQPALPWPQAQCFACCAAEGVWVQPQQVVGPDQPGRKLCILGHAPDLRPALPWALQADTVVLGADLQVQCSLTLHTPPDCARAGHNLPVPLIKGNHWTGSSLLLPQAQKG